ncbi:MAG: BcepF1 [Alphaproteobacteria bacterium]|nr:BcepF1 [Alphaproteobacteria bacterium]
MTPLIVFDLDGTLALIEHRKHFIHGRKKNWRRFFAACTDDLPNIPVIATFQALQAQGHRLEIWSGRSDEVRVETEAWLAQYYIRAEKLRMRRHDDHSPDDQLKEKWLLENELETGQKPLVIFDDRNKVVAMWRRHGVTCFQVAEGDF